MPNCARRLEGSILLGSRLRNMVLTVARLEREAEVGLLPRAPGVDELMATDSNVAAIALQASDIDDVKVGGLDAVNQVSRDVVVVVRIKRVHVFAVYENFNLAAVRNQPVKRLVVLVKECVLEIGERPVEGGVVVVRSIVEAASVTAIIPVYEAANDNYDCRAQVMATVPRQIPGNAPIPVIGRKTALPWDRSVAVVPVAEMPIAPPRVAVVIAPSKLVLELANISETGRELPFVVQEMGDDRVAWSKL